VNLQKMRDQNYGKEYVCAVRYPKVSCLEETLCGMWLPKISEDEELSWDWNLPIGEPFIGHYDNITCCNCRDTINDFIELLTMESVTELQKMRDHNGKDLVCAVRYCQNEHYCKETLCGTVYNLYDIGKNEDTCLNIPIGKQFSGHYGDITCGSCRDVIEYYQFVPNFSSPPLLTPPTPHPPHAIPVKPRVSAQQHIVVD